MEDFDVRAVVLVGGERALVFDTLAHPSQMEGVSALVGDRPVTVVYSHADWDHAWGTCGLPRWDEVVAQEHAAERFRTDVPEELDRRREGDPAAWRDVALVPPDVTFATRHTLGLGGMTVELRALPGHTPDCLVALVPERGLLLAGDTVETPLPVVNDGGAVEGWIAALAEWEGNPAVETVVPSHGPVGGRFEIQRTRAYLEALLGEDEWMAPGAGAAVRPFYVATHQANRRAVAARR